MPALDVIDACRQPFEVERSFRMAKSDLRARPIFHRRRDSIEAHLTIVFCALAISRMIQAKTGPSIKRSIHQLEPLRTGVVMPNGKRHEFRPRIDEGARKIIKALTETEIW